MKSLCDIRTVSPVQAVLCWEINRLIELWRGVYRQSTRETVGTQRRAGEGRHYCACMFANYVGYGMHPVRLSFSECTKVCPVRAHSRR